MVVSSAALATLTVASPILDKDVLLKVVSQLASPKQLKVSIKKKGNDLSLALLEFATLTQRNAILRSLAGPALHHAMDGKDLYLLGGYSAAARSGGSPTASMALSSLGSWMTVAGQVRDGSTAVPDLLPQLESYLKDKSFLIPSGQATLVDYDVLLSVLEKTASGDDDDGSIVASYPAVTRWMRTTYAQLSDLAAKCTNAVELPALGLEDLVVPAPVFFYGSEDFTPVKVASTAGGKASGGAGSGGGAAAAAGPAGGAGELSEEQKKAAAEKRAKKKAEKSKKKPAQPPKGAAPADYDITALDIRVGKIVKAWHHPEAEKLFCEEIDLGEDKPRQIASGLRPFYKTEDFADRRVLVLANLKARNLVGFPSHGMVLCASNADHTAVEFVSPPADAKIGERVMFGDLGEKPPEAENKVGKKKILEKVLPDLKTNADGVVVWKDQVSSTSGGPCSAVNKMAGAQVA